MTGKYSLDGYRVGKSIGAGSFSKVKLGIHIASKEQVAIKIIDKKKMETFNIKKKNHRRETKLQELVKNIKDKPFDSEDSNEMKPNTFSEIVAQLQKKKAELQKATIEDDVVTDGTIKFISAFQEEILLMMRLDHPNIIKIHEIIESPDYTYMVMEYASGGELADFITSCGPLSEKEARRLFRQILSAVHHIHTANVVHRDLKLENILLDRYRNILIADFGLGRSIEEDTKLNTYCGTPNFAAIEIVLSLPYDGIKADIWSLGVILYIMCSGKRPFTGETIKILYKNISKLHYHIPSNFSVGLKTLIQSIFVQNPDQRITMDQLFHHPWVSLDEGCPIKIPPKLTGKIDETLLSNVISSIRSDKDSVIYTFNSAFNNFNKSSTTRQPKETQSIKRARRKSTARTSDYTPAKHETATQNNNVSRSHSVAFSDGGSTNEGGSEMGEPVQSFQLRNSTQTENNTQSESTPKEHNPTVSYVRRVSGTNTKIISNSDFPSSKFPDSEIAGKLIGTHSTSDRSSHTKLEMPLGNEGASHEEGESRIVGFSEKRFRHRSSTNAPIPSFINKNEFLNLTHSSGESYSATAIGSSPKHGNEIEKICTKTAPTMISDRPRIIGVRRSRSMFEPRKNSNQAMSKGGHKETIEIIDPYVDFASANPVNINSVFENSISYSRRGSLADSPIMEEDIHDFSFPKSVGAIRQKQGSLLSGMRRRSIVDNAVQAESSLSFKSERRYSAASRKSITSHNSISRDEYLIDRMSAVAVTPTSSDEVKGDPTMNEIVSWHETNAIPKRVRNMRFNFNRKSMSMLEPAAMFIELQKVLAVIAKDYDLEFHRVPEYYQFDCILNDIDGQIVFEVEICKVAMLKLHAVRMKRIQGDRFKFQELHDEILSSLNWK